MKSSQRHWLVNLIEYWMQQRLLQWEVPSGLCQKRCRCCDSCLYKELEEYTSSLTIALQFRQLRLANATELKSDNLQYNTLVRWDKWLVDQASDVPSKDDYGSSFSSGWQNSGVWDINEFDFMYMFSFPFSLQPSSGQLRGKLNITYLKIFWGLPNRT